MRAALISILLGLLGLSQATPSAPPLELELRYLANEGFYLRCGEHGVLIDAFVTEPYGPYAALPKELFEDLVARKAPFEDVDLALTSHVHRDHFQAEAAAAYLEKNPSIPFLSSPQVLAELETRSPGGEEGREALLPENNGRRAATLGGIRLELLRLPHSGGARTASVENLGHVIELGGARVLHVGDADAEVAELAAYALAESKIDVALVPYWWLGDARGLELARKVTGAKHLVAVHVPPKEVAEVKAHLAQLDPQLLVFQTAGEARKLTLER
jgi:L-ascorbate metabolism protein UlaG (beta-lactamase superfamily)